MTRLHLHGRRSRRENGGGGGGRSPNNWSGGALISLSPSSFCLFCAFVHVWYNNSAFFTHVWGPYKLGYRLQSGPGYSSALGFGPPTALRWIDAAVALLQAGTYDIIRYRRSNQPWFIVKNDVSRLDSALLQHDSMTTAVSWDLSDLCVVSLVGVVEFLPQTVQRQTGHAHLSVCVVKIRQRCVLRCCVKLFSIV